MALLNSCSPDRAVLGSPRQRHIFKGPWIYVAVLGLLLLIVVFTDTSTLSEALSIGPLRGINQIVAGHGEMSGKSRGVQQSSSSALDWLSPWEPPPGFENWINFAKDNKCHLGTYTRIEKDLQQATRCPACKTQSLEYVKHQRAQIDHHPSILKTCHCCTRQFRDDKHPLKRHIGLQQIEEAKKIGNVVVFTVKNGRLKYNQKTPFAIKFATLMKRFARFLPDTEFVVNSLDEPRSLPGETDDIDLRFASKQCENASETFRLQRDLHGTINNRAEEGAYQPNTRLLPIFSQSKINECYADITYPTLYNLDNILTEKEEEELLPWAQRNDTLFFRGATTGGFYSSRSDFTKAHRQRLVEHAMEQPHMDIKFSNYLQCSDICTEMADKYGYGGWVAQKDNFKYKYLMSIDGNTFVSRLPLFLSSASVPFRAGIYSEWYDEWLKENEHYIQVKLDYSDLDAKLQWAIDHDTEMRIIGQKGRLFAKNRLRNQDMECYLFRLLLEYASIVY